MTDTKPATKNPTAAWPVASRDPGEGLNPNIATSAVRVLHMTNPGTVVVPHPETGAAVTLQNVRLTIATNGARIERGAGMFLATKAVDPDNLPTVAHKPGIGWVIGFPDGATWIANRLVKGRRCRSCGGR